MTQITAKLVADLRGRTGAGMMDCKKALEETAGDIEKAVDLLRAKGIAKAEKRAGRQASEGQIVTLVSPDGATGAVIEVNCETDFVGRNDEFRALAQSMAEQVAGDAAVNGTVVVGSEGEYLNAAFHKGGTVGEALKAASAKTGENVVMRRVARFASPGGTVGAYLHHNGKVGVLVEIAGGQGEAVMTLAKQVAEHVAAGVPSVAVAVDKDGVSPELVEREKAIFTEQAAQSGKPANIVEKMVSGRIEKFYAEVTLLNQPWVRDDSKTIGQLVKEAGAGLSVVRFARFQMGEE